MPNSVIWGVRITEWDAESLRPKEQIHDVPALMWANLVKAKEAAIEAATELWNEYHEGDGTAGPPAFPVFEWSPEPNGHWLNGFDGISYEQDEAGFWVFVYQVEIDLSTRATDAEIREEIENEAYEDRMAGREEDE